MSEKVDVSFDCPSCGKSTMMLKLGSVSDVTSQETDEDGQGFEYGDIYEVLKCPKCDEVAIQKGKWHDGMDVEDWKATLIYPEPKKERSGLPPKVQQEYAAARLVASTSANAFGVLIGRVLDAVCADRGAVGETLNERLKDLAAKQEIPLKLAEMAHGVRVLRNVGAHADLGSLTDAEVPVLDSLCTVILEYVYEAPKMVALVESRIKALKAANKATT